MNYPDHEVPWKFEIVATLLGVLLWIGLFACARTDQQVEAEQVPLPPKDVSCKYIGIVGELGDSTRYFTPTIWRCTDRTTDRCFYILKYGGDGVAITDVFECSVEAESGQ